MPLEESERGTRSGRKNDPARRDHIIAASLDVISEVGVAGASHRRIAVAAGVPLGSMTYYFAGIDEILREAFTRFSIEISERFEERMRAATDLASARESIVALIVGDVLADRRELVLSHELYALAAREPSFRALTTEWMQRSRNTLERHFEPRTARILDALIEGLSIHRVLDEQPRDRAEVELAVARITATLP